MTIAIGVKTTDGAILASDCKMFFNRPRPSCSAQKIHPALHYTEDESEDHKITGVYHSRAGSFGIMDLGLVSAEVFSRSQNVADLLTDESVLSYPLPGLNNMKDSIETAYRAATRKGKIDSKYYELRKDLEQVTLRRDVRSFVDSTESSYLSDINRLVLRISENYNPDILSMSHNSVTSVLYEVIGSGRDLVGDELASGYSAEATTGDLLPLVAKLLNKALEDSRYSGYQLVIVQKLDDGVGIRTAQDLEADKIDLEKVVYLDPWFYPVEK